MYSYEHKNIRQPHRGAARPYVRPDFITFLSPSNGTIGNQPFNFTKRVAQGGASRKLPTFASCMYEKRRTVPAQ